MPAENSEVADARPAGIPERASGHVAKGRRSWPDWRPHPGATARPETPIIATKAHGVWSGVPGLRGDLPPLDSSGRIFRVGGHGIFDASGWGDGCVSSWVRFLFSVGCNMLNNHLVPLPVSLSVADIGLRDPLTVDDVCSPWVWPLTVDADPVDDADDLWAVVCGGAF